jgi:hypothetical protein
MKEQQIVQSSVQEICRSYRAAFKKYADRRSRNMSGVQEICAAALNKSERRSTNLRGGQKPYSSVEDSGGAVDGAERTAALCMAMWTSLRSRGKPPGVRCLGRVSPGDRPGWGSAAPGERVPNGPEIFTGPISTAGCGHGEMCSLPLGIGLPNKAYECKKP